MSSVFAAFPSYKGISDDEAKERCAEKALVAAGHSVAVAVVRSCALIDYARAELMAAFINTRFEMVLCQDDDVKVEDKTLLRMIELMSLHGTPSGRDAPGVISAPCKMRNEGNLYNVVPTSEPDERRLAECLWTGLGCVLVHQQVIMKLSMRNTQLMFPSDVAKGVQAVGLFNSIVADAGDYDPSRAGEGMFLGDDRAFSHRLRQARIPIYAYVDARTDHRGLEGCLGDDIRKNQAPQRGRLVDAKGDPL